MTSDETNHGPGETDERSQSPSMVIKPDSIGPIMEMLDDLETQTEEFEAEQKLIASILERHDGTAQLLTIADEMGAQPHEIAVPIDLMHQSGVVDVSGSRLQLSVALADED